MSYEHELLLDASDSYDPDYPDTILGYEWSCVVVASGDDCQEVSLLIHHTNIHTRTPLSLTHTHTHTHIHTPSTHSHALKLTYSCVSCYVSYFSLVLSLVEVHN